MKNKKVPMRKCIGCMESKPKKDLIRIANWEGNITVDFTGKAKGRGVYLCNNPECIEKAKKKNALQRSFQMNIDEATRERIFEELLNNEK